MKTCVHTSVSDKNQSSSQTKGFMHGLVLKILETCDREANIYLHPGANYTYMYNLHTMCKSAHVNGAIYDMNIIYSNTYRSIVVKKIIFSYTNHAHDGYYSIT